MADGSHCYTHPQGVHHGDALVSGVFEDGMNRVGERPLGGERRLERRQFRLSRESSLEQKEHAFLVGCVRSEFLDGEASDDKLTRVPVNITEPGLRDGHSFQSRTNFLQGHTSTTTNETGIVIWRTTLLLAIDVRAGSTHTQCLSK